MRPKRCRSDALLSQKAQKVLPLLCAGTHEAIDERRLQSGFCCDPRQGPSGSVTVAMEGLMKDNDTSLKLDHLDLKILAKLQADARITNQELADAVGLSPSPCLQRVKRLERAGIIALYQAQIDLSKVCRHVDVIAAVTLNSHGLEDFNEFERMVAGMRHVVECTKLSGTIDYLVRFVCPDIGSYQMLSDELLKLGPKVGNLSSYIVLKAVKPFRGVVLDDLVSPH
jgi:DNA-binding Lrp family transcriptional regulator